MDLRCNSCHWLFLLKVLLAITVACCAHLHGLQDFNSRSLRKNDLAELTQINSLANRIFLRAPGILKRLDFRPHQKRTTGAVDSSGYDIWEGLQHSQTNRHRPRVRNCANGSFPLTICSRNFNLQNLRNLMEDTESFRKRRRRTIAKSS